MHNPPPPGTKRRVYKPRAKRALMKTRGAARRREPITDDMIEEALRNAGGIQKDAAEAIATAMGRTFSRQAMHARVHNNPERFFPIIEETRETTLDLAESVILKALNAGDYPTARWFLDRCGHARGYRPNFGVTGADGDPLIPAGAFAPPEVHIYIPDNGRNPHLTRTIDHDIPIGATKN